MIPQSRSLSAPFGEGDIRLIKGEEKFKRFIHSLYVRLVLVILTGLIAAVGVYTAARFLGNNFIEKYYITEEHRESREENYIHELQRYVTDKKISSEDTDMIADWAQNNRYVYLLIYKNNELFFSSDMLPGEDDKNNGSQTPDKGESDGGGESSDSSSQTKPENKPENKDDSYGSGITVQFPTREELKKYAEENDLYELEMDDGVLLASVAEFTEYFYYDFANIASLIFAMLVLACILVFYFKRIISRVKRLDTNVMEVANGDINLPVTGEGYDEIARLSANVENMRRSIIKSIEEEREARRANTELITAMSHDIRTPLTVLLGYLEIMKNEAADEKMRAYAETSENTAMRLKDLSDDMFNYFLAFGSTKETFDIEEYDANTLFEQILSEPLILLNEQGYNVDYKYDFSALPKDSVVKTDAPKFMRIIDNIFSNLSKYADKEYPIVFSVKADADLFTLLVKNRKKKNKNEAESNGIGLKTCARLAGFVAESFEYGDEGEDFFVLLTVKIHEKETGA